MEYCIQNGCTISVNENASIEEFYAFEKSLKADGYRRYFSSEMCENVFAGYEKDGRSVYFYFLARTRQLRVLEGDYAPLLSYEAGKRIRKTAVINFGFDFSQNPLTKEGSPLSQQGCGLGCVIILEDSSYVIIDGGAMHTDTDVVVEHLHDLLVSNNARTDGKIVIAAWMFTHLHNDHCTTFERFSRKYGKTNRVEIKNLVYNYPWTWQMLCFKEGLCTDTEVAPALDYIFKTCYDTPPTVYVPRTGHRFNLCGWEVEILSTYDEFFPNAINRSNDASMVFRFNPKDLDGVNDSVLFLGDIEKEASELVVSLHGDYLKTKIVQVAHHGYMDGGSESLYRAIGAEHLIWPNSWIRWYGVENSKTGRVVPDWIKSAANTPPVAYPQCNKEQAATDTYLTFENGEIMSATDTLPLNSL